MIKALDDLVINGISLGTYGSLTADFFGTDRTQGSCAAYLKEQSIMANSDALAPLSFDQLAGIFFVLARYQLFVAPCLLLFRCCSFQAASGGWLPIHPPLSLHPPPVADPGCGRCAHSVDILRDLRAQEKEAPCRERGQHGAPTAAPNRSHQSPPTTSRQIPCLCCPALIEHSYQNNTRRCSTPQVNDFTVNAAGPAKAVLSDPLQTDWAELRYQGNKGSLNTLSGRPGLLNPNPMLDFQPRPGEQPLQATFRLLVSQVRDECARDMFRVPESLLHSAKRALAQGMTVRALAEVIDANGNVAGLVALEGAKRVGRLRCRLGFCWSGSRLKRAWPCSVMLRCRFVSGADVHAARAHDARGGCAVPAGYCGNSEDGRARRARAPEAAAAEPGKLRERERSGAGPPAPEATAADFVVLGRHPGRVN